jgi:hypothetical protein
MGDGSGAGQAWNPAQTVSAFHLLQLVYGKLQSADSLGLATFEYDLKPYWGPLVETLNALRPTVASMPAAVRVEVESLARLVNELPINRPVAACQRLAAPDVFALADRGLTAALNATNPPLVEWAATAAAAPDVRPIAGPAEPAEVLERIAALRRAWPTAHELGKRAGYNPAEAVTLLWTDFHAFGWNPPPEPDLRELKDANVVVLFATNKQRDLRAKLHRRYVEALAIAERFATAKLRDAAPALTEIARPTAVPAKLTPAVARAWESWRLAEESHLPGLLDDDAFEWLLEAPDSLFVGPLLGYCLPERATWKRHLRTARKSLDANKHVPRAGRVAGSSIIRQQDR